MKRNMETVREILLEVEAKDDGRALRYDIKSLSVEKRHHVNLLLQAGLLVEVGATRSADSKKVHLSWDGHDFVDAVRDKTIWDETKATAANAGGFTLKLLQDIAVGYIKAKAQEQLGMHIG